MVTTFDPGRMIWNGYTGAAGWMFRQALEGVLGLRLAGGRIVPPADLAPAGELGLIRVSRDTDREPAAKALRSCDLPLSSSRPNRQCSRHPDGADIHHARTKPMTPTSSGNPRARMAAGRHAAACSASHPCMFSGAGRHDEPLPSG